MQSTEEAFKGCVPILHSQMGIRWVKWTGKTQQKLGDAASQKQNAASQQIGSTATRYRAVASSSQEAQRSVKLEAKRMLPLTCASLRVL